MSTLVISSGIWFGYEFTTFLIRNRFEYLVRISIGACFGIAFQSFIFFISSSFYQLTKIHAIIVSLFFFFMAYFFAYLNRKFYPSKVIRYAKHDLFILLVCGLFICAGVYNANMQNGFYTRGPAFADLPFHLNIISSFSQGINYKRKSLFDVWSCFQADVRLAYPMFHNLYIAVLINCNDISLSSSLQTTAIIFSLSFIILLYEVFYTYSKSRIISSLSLVTWILLGGLGYTMIFHPIYNKQRANNWILRFSKDHHTTWMQPLIHILIPQRSALFASPLVLTCLICLMKGVKRWDYSYFALAGFCTAFLPQLQVHSFVAMAQFSIATCLIFFPSKLEFRRTFISWLIYGTISCVIGLPLTFPYWVRENENTSSFIRFERFWSDDIYGPLICPIIQIWWKSLGPFGFIMLLFGWVFATSFQLKFWFAAMFVFIITMFVIYQPWKMDNLKLLFAVWLPIAVPYVTQFYVSIYTYATNAYKKTNKSIHTFIMVVVIFLMLQNTFSSILSFNREYFLKIRFVSKAEYQCGEWISENTPIDSIFMSYSSRFNPASAFAGRQLYLGFISWTAQHGVSGPNRQLQTTKLLQDTNDADFFADEGIQYALLSETQDFKFPLKGQSPWITVYQNYPYTIYKLNQTNIKPPYHKRDKSNITSMKPEILPGLFQFPTPSMSPTPSIRRKKQKIIYNFSHDD